MKKILLKIKDNQLTPGNKLTGGVLWQLPDIPQSLEVRLFWSTKGRGDEDLQIVASKHFTPATQGKEKFAFTLPEGPYSFSSKLITLTWGIEFIDEKGQNFAAEEFVLSPNGQEIQI